MAGAVIWKPKRGVVKEWLLAVKSRLIRPRMRGETFRKWASRNLENSPFASGIDVFQVFLGLAVTFIYFYENWRKFQDVTESATLRNVQTVIGVFFTVDYVVRFYVADSRETYFFSTMSAVDLATIVPQWFEMAITDDTNLKNQANALKTLRALRFLRAFRLLVFTKTAKGRQAGILFLTVMSLIICTAGIIQAIEQCAKPTDTKCQNLEIYNACYFVVITIATLGYGDIAPKSDNGKLAVIFLIFFTGILLPLQISRYSDILNRETEYDKSFKEPKERNPHILICGEVNSSALDFFLRQFLHPNNMNWKDKVVILCPGLPSHNLKRILLNPAYEQRVVYLQGSAMLDSDLKRAAAANARMCYVLLNKLSQDGDRNDTASNLLTISLRHHTNDVPLFVQVLKTDNIRHIHMSGATNIICIDEMKLGILAKTCVIPGLCAFLCNILFTFRPFYNRSTLWASEFLSGCAHDVYEAKLPPYLDGLISFSLLAMVLYKEYNIVAVATAGRNHMDMKLFPAKATMRAFHKIYILATTPDAPRRVEMLPLSLLQKYEAHLTTFDQITAAWNATSISGKIRTTIRHRSSVGRYNGSSVISMDSSRLGPGEMSKSMDDMQSARRNTGTITRVLPCEVEDEMENSSSDGRAIDHGALPDQRSQRALFAPSTIPSATPLLPDASPIHATPGSPSSSTSESQLATTPSKSALITVPSHESTTAMLLHKEAATNRPAADDHIPTDDESGAGDDDADTMVPDPANPSMPFRPRSNTGSIAFDSFMDTGIPTNMANHIILCGMPNSLYDFVAPLRPVFARTASKLAVGEAFGSTTQGMGTVPIVIISQILMSEKQHASIAMFTGIYYLHGSPLHEDVLRAACVFRARSIVILSNCTQTSAHVDEMTDPAADMIDQNMIDTDAITLHRFITEACECNCPHGGPLPTVIIELSRPSSLRFVKDEMYRAEHPTVLTAVKAVTKQVLSRADDPLDNICHPIYAAGNVFISNSLDAVLGSCNHYGTIIDLFHLLVFGDSIPPDGTNGANRRALDQINVPLEYVQRPYGECFVEMLTKQDILCLGLYRARQHRHSFVFVNPDEDVVVQDCDKLFVLR
ncbi:Aste57867_13311 [Aphanomyces stellatus]|uniref:BK channel n=1 Tax=Aphanomyces stellatus TaxID=120398 RepID=A0A485KY23_9STRA|nr:hypothetical protein As57867_013262 [Aphanomyces stellatus]VFT90150.1 Aste57867_13311 [Aphanomyces stellatus]